MKSSARHSQRRLLATEILDALLGFLQRHFYNGEAVTFAKDRPRILDWVVLEPARWLDTRGVTMSGEAYRDLFLDPKTGLLFEALRHGATDTIRYRPAWLRQVIQSHLRIHGDAIYARAKSITLLADQALLAASHLTRAPRPDPVRELANLKASLRADRKARPGSRTASTRSHRASEAEPETQLPLF
jgi:hypothetical protein